MLLFALMVWLYYVVGCKCRRNVYFIHFYRTHRLLTPSRAHKREKAENFQQREIHRWYLVRDAYLNGFPRTYFFSHSRLHCQDQAKYNFISFVIWHCYFYSAWLLFNSYSKNAHPNNCTHTGTHKMVLLDSYCLVYEPLYIFEEHVNSTRMYFDVHAMYVCVFAS